MGLPESVLKYVGRTQESVWLAKMAIRMTGGNFRLLTRLLTQIERVLSVNDLHLVSTAVVEAARDSLVIGP